MKTLGDWKTLPARRDSQSFFALLASDGGRMQVSEYADEPTALSELSDRLRDGSLQSLIYGREVSVATEVKTVFRVGDQPFRQVIGDD